MSDVELMEAMRLVDVCEGVLAKAKEDLAVGMAARQFRQEIRATRRTVASACGLAAQ